MRQATRSVVVIAILLLLTGCMFPESELEKNKIPNESQLEMVQHAVTEYRKETDGLIPIKTKEADVDYYEKYVIDFNTLKDQQLLTEIPATAFENGGVYQYTIIDPEDNPTVKLIDLRLSQTVRDVNTKLNIYRSKHTYPPFGEKIADGMYTLNYAKLGYKNEPTARSPYTENPLPIIIDEAGKVYIDYRSDLQLAWNEFEADYKEEEDIRPLLTEHYPFVPVYSTAYTIKDGEVAFLKETE